MKKKDIITIIISVVIIVIIIGLVYRYLIPPSSNTGVQVEVPHPVVPTFDQEQLNTLKNDVKDYSQDLTPKDTGGNNQIIQ
ncbi:MAG: hypothetical protein QG675_31 [Patescibacteria group bacterium]|jgi:flagellar basal body-associated protein FliL|nr:hypothetical protein [Patescibacteria group bacterium]